MEKITVRVFPDEIVLGHLVIMRFSVHLCQRKSCNKHSSSGKTLTVIFSRKALGEGVGNHEVGVKRNKTHDTCPI
jgi:hypothetical protein